MKSTPSGDPPGDPAASPAEQASELMARATELSATPLDMAPIDAPEEDIDGLAAKNDAETRGAATSAYALRQVQNSPGGAERITTARELRSERKAATIRLTKAERRRREIPATTEVAVKQPLLSVGMWTVGAGLNSLLVAGSVAVELYTLAAPVLGMQTFTMDELGSALWAWPGCGPTLVLGTAILKLTPVEQRRELRLRMAWLAAVAWLVFLVGSGANAGGLHAAGKDTEPRQWVPIELLTICAPLAMGATTFCLKEAVLYCWRRRTYAEATPVQQIKQADAELAAAEAINDTLSGATELADELLRQNDRQAEHQAIGLIARVEAAHAARSAAAQKAAIEKHIARLRARFDAL
jgi:hypothetical protein